MKKLTIALLATLTFSAPALAVDAKVVDAVMAETFGKAPALWQERMKLDETEVTCTETRSAPSTSRAQLSQSIPPAPTEKKVGAASPQAMHWSSSGRQPPWARTLTA